MYLSRARLGKELARLEKTFPTDVGTIVVPVPDTAKAAADAMAFELGLPCVEGLMRNRYVGRTFIEGTADREAKARLKYTPLPEVMAGKRVLLVEDSIVRSTTMRALVKEIRERGQAREIHLRVACPPIIAPCFYGIDMSSRDELIAPQYADLPDGSLSEDAQRRWRTPSARAAFCVTSPSSPSPVPSASPQIASAAPASPADTPPQPASVSTRSTASKPATPTARAVTGVRTYEGKAG